MVSEPPDSSERCARPEQTAVMSAIVPCASSLRQTKTQSTRRSSLRPLRLSALSSLEDEGSGNLQPFSVYSVPP